MTLVLEKWLGYHILLRMRRILLWRRPYVLFLAHEGFLWRWFRSQQVDSPLSSQQQLARLSGRLGLV